MTEGVRTRGPLLPRDEALLSSDALSFLAGLQRRFGPRRQELLSARSARQASIDAGELPCFPPETADVRDAEWTVDPVPSDLVDRRVEITGPVDRKMVIHALNSGATHYMADFEDSTAPTWRNLLDGQANLYDAVRRTITFDHPTKGTYRLLDDIATLLVRPRGWHLDEGHLSIDGMPMSASLFDFGLFFFHNAVELRQRGGGPYFYLPKLEHYLEARLWNEVFEAAQLALDLPRGTIRATVLVETLPASFQLDEILWELRHHSSGLNCGRWDYIFSTIKTLRAHPDRLLPDRSQVGMTAPFMKAYTTRVIQVCHRRGVHAMGGMAAQIPIKGDDAAHRDAMDKVLGDKEREVRDGHDGTWVAHPALVPLARGVFDHHMPGPHQLRRRPDTTVTEADLLALPHGTRTLAGLRHSIQVGVRYLEAWLRGQGCVPLFHLMEDAATAEICRAQVWQWVHHGATLSDGTPVTEAALAQWVDEERHAIDVASGSNDHRFDEAAALFLRLSTSDELVPFLTLAAYPSLLTLED